MKFSIVTPSYNQGQFIDETIESIWGQAGNFTIEHIVMDGGSTDDTVSILKKWQKKLQTKKFKPRCQEITFSWVSKKDKGQSDAINQGFTKCSGDIFAYLNSDDVYAPDCFEIVANAFRKKTTHFVYGNCEFIDDKGNTIPSHKATSRPFNINQLLNEKNYILQPATFWRRSVYQKVGDFNESLHYVMDYEYWIRIHEAGFKLEYLANQVLAKFRIYANAKSTKYEKKSWQEKRTVSRQHGAQFYNLMMYFQLKNELITNFNNYGLPGDKIFDLIAKTKRLFF